MKRIDTIEQLRSEILDNGNHDFFITLNGGVRSSKQIDVSEDGKTFFIINEIDDSEDQLTEEQLNNRHYTNIGYAISHKAFYCYE